MPDLQIMPEFSISPVVTMNILPTVPVLLKMKQSCIDIPASISNHAPRSHAPQVYGHLQPEHDEPYHADFDLQPDLDVKNYSQHRLTDYQDPEVREIKRQENVETTLRMIDVALGLYK